MPEKKRIAVLGGGVGALSAVFYLTEQKDWADKYDITVYQQGWRLGGKCASGRDMRPGYGHRIYEHGLHIFAGFYDQSFDLLRRAYEVIDRPEGHPNRTVWDAFTPEDQIALVDNDTPGHPSETWFLNFPANDGRPGDDLTIPPLIDMIEQLVAMLLHISPKTGSLEREAPEKEGLIGSLLHKICGILRRFMGAVENEIEEDVFNLSLHEIVHTLHEEMARVHNPGTLHEYDVALSRFLKSAFCTQAVLHGIADDRVYAKGFDSLDQYDWAEWIEKNALAIARKFPEWGDPETRARELVEWTPIRSMYDYAFALQDVGKSNRGNFAAGTALRAGLLLVSYKGHFFWKMRGAMGDVVIAPIYLALLKRGVKFEFFKRITSVNLASDNRSVSSVDFVDQAALKNPAQGYGPLIDVPVPGWPDNARLAAWPAEPLWDQIQNGTELHAAGRDYEADHKMNPGPQDRPGRLEVGKDYDQVLLGISLGGLKQVCADFPARLPQSKWGATFDKLTLTRTCAMQLWLRRSTADLGNKGPGRTLSGAEQPYSSWSDMTHLLEREVWNDADRPRSIAYFCGQIGGDETGQAAHDKAERAGKTWLKGNASEYWPEGTALNSAYGLDPKLLFDPDPSAGGGVFSRQYVRNNYNPSDLYVQSPKDSVQARMDPGESGVENLFLAGDWTLNEMNSGCVEGAARSGARCARAIAGEKQPPIPLQSSAPPVQPKTDVPPAVNLAQPSYVIDGNLYDSLGAALLEDVIMHTFCLPASREKQQAWLDRTFSAPSAGKVTYEAMSDKIFLGIAELGKVKALGPGAAEKGYTNEIDVTLWILARRRHAGLISLRWIPAYLFVDSGPVLVTGREVWGFPKQLGRFDFSPLDLDPGAARTFSVEATVVSPYGAESPARWAPIIEVRPSTATPAKPHGILGTLEHLAAQAVERLTDDLLSVSSHIENAIGAGEITMSFLKQLPDATHPHLASYQAIIEAEAKVLKMRGSGLTHQSYEARITSYDSMPLFRELGLKPDWQVVGQGVWTDFDFRQELGKEVWRAV